MSGLRFAMITTFYPPYNFGGDGIGIQRLSRALVRRGHEVTVIHDVNAYRALSGGNEPTAAVADDGVQLVSLRSRLGLLSPLLTQQTGRPVVHGERIRHLLDRGEFDVINFHNVSLVGGPGVLQAGSGLKVYMAHEHWLVCPTHVLWRHGREACTGRECTRCVLRARRPPQLWRYTGFLERELRHIDLFIAMSEFSRQKHREFGFPREMEVLPYFLPEVEPSSGHGADESPHPRPYFLFVGRLEKIKGLDDVLPVFSADADADLLVAGDGEHASALRAIAGESQRIRFLGRVPNDELSRYYRHAVGLIVPSVCFETFGIILIEAFRQGLPVVARDIGPFPDLIRQSGGGLLFGSDDELRTALNRLRHEPGLREEMSRRGRASFELHWTEDAVVPRYLALIQAAADRKGVVLRAHRQDPLGYRGHGSATTRTAVSP